MKLSISKSELQNALAIVIKGVSTRSTLPVLSGILLEATGDSLVLQATDLELSIQYSTAALVEEEGKAVVPGKLFSDIVKNLPDAAVHVEADEENALITCDSSSFSIKALNYEDFPGFPHVEASQRIEVPFTKFAAMVKKVARAVSKDESRAILTGALVTLEENHFKMVATDSYRLALAEGKHGTRAKIDVSHLVAAVKRTSLLGSSSTPIKFDLNAASQTVQLSAASQDVGSAQETLSCSIEGDDAEIAFNFAYVLDGLSSVSSDSVYLEVGTSREPGIFKAEAPENFLYLVMPVRIS